MERKMALEARMTAVRKGNHDIDIVQAVQGSKVLYDKSHENHKNPRVKEVEWQRIGEELGVPAMAVIKRWTVIRERFASEKRKVQQLGPSSWWLMQHMDWLNAHIQPRQRGKYLPQNDSATSPLPNLPNLTHISNLPPLTSISHYNNGNLTIQPRGYSNGNTHRNDNLSQRYMGDEDQGDSRSNSPILSIAYPEVCMKDISSEDEDSSYVSMKTDNGSYASTKTDNGSNLSLKYENGYMKDEGRQSGRGSTDGEMRSRRGTNGSEDSSGPLALGLDLDEAACARLMAALKGVDDPVLRHRLRQRAHHLAEECELAALQTFHHDKKIKTDM